MGYVTLAPGMERGSPEYERLKEERSQVLWHAVERIIPDVRQRAEIALVQALHAAATLAAPCLAMGHPERAAVFRPVAKFIPACVLLLFQGLCLGCEGCMQQMQLHYHAC